MGNHSNTNELYHYGVKGMKWGRRRYQNPDGSLTEKGIKRYAQKGYAQDSYNSNKTRLGKVYDKVTDAHKYAGAAMYGASSKAENKRRAEQYIADKAASKAKKNDPKGADKDVAKKEANAQKADNKKMRSELRDVALQHPTAYHMNKHAKRAAVSGVGALATATIGSAATAALAKHGKVEAAALVYKNSRKAFDAFATAAKMETGMAAINYMMGGGATNSAYRADVRKIREKHKN